MKHWDTVYQDNHLSLMKIHFGLAIFYVLIMSGILFLILNDVSCSQIQWGNFLILVIIMIIPSSVHMALAYGARAKLELSRRLSMVVFILLFLIFPIGSIFSACVGFPVLQTSSTYAVRIPLIYTHNFFSTHTRLLPNQREGILTGNPHDPDAS